MTKVHYWSTGNWVQITQTDRQPNRKAWEWTAPSGRKFLIELSRTLSAGRTIWYKNAPKGTCDDHDQHRIGTLYDTVREAKAYAELSEAKMVRAERAPKETARP
jgi:hypothetical protein